MNYVKAISRIKTIGIVCLLLILSAWDMRAQSNDSIVVAPDSSNFVTASLLVAEPVGASFSVFGHVSIRMECPVHNLDYVFTLTNNPNTDPFTTGFLGKADARFVAVPTDTCIRDTRKEQRQLMQYKLNLTHHEKQELWRLLDEEMVAVSHGKFNFQTNSCVTSIVMNIQQCLIDEHFEWGPMEYPRTLNDGDFLRYTLRGSPWTEFLYVTFCGAAYSNHSPEEERMTPQGIVPLLRKAKFTNNQDGSSRPVIVDKGTMLVKGKGKEKEFPLTPSIVFSILLLLSVVVSLAEWKWQTKRLVKWYDMMLFGTQAAIGLLLLLVVFHSEVFVSRWNWHLIPFFPVPLLLWLFERRNGNIPKKWKKNAKANKQKKTAQCWFIYSCVLMLFILATPFIGVLDIPHQLITGSLLVRSVGNYNASKTKIN